MQINSESEALTERNQNTQKESQSNYKLKYFSFSIIKDIENNKNEKYLPIENQILYLKPNPNTLSQESQAQIYLTGTKKKIVINKKIISRLINNESVFANKFRKYELYALGANETTHSLFKHKIGNIIPSRIPTLSLKNSEEFSNIKKVSDSYIESKTGMYPIKNKISKKNLIKNYLDPIKQRKEEEKENTAPSLSLNFKRKIKEYENINERVKQKRFHSKYLAPIHSKLNTINSKIRNRKTNMSMKSSYKPNTENPYTSFESGNNRMKNDWKFTNKTSIRKHRNSRKTTYISNSIENKNTEQQIKDMEITLDSNNSQNFKLVLRQPFEYPFFNSGLKPIRIENSDLNTKDFPINLNPWDNLEKKKNQKEEKKSNKSNYFEK